MNSAAKKTNTFFDCSDIDDIITFQKDGTMKVVKEAKTFHRKNIVHVGVFEKGDKRTVYNMIYREGKEGHYYMKRFSVTGVTRNTDYKLASDKKVQKCCIFLPIQMVEAETVTVLLKPNSRVRKIKLRLIFRISD